MPIINTIAEYVTYTLEGAAIIVVFAGAVQAVSIYVRRGLLKKVNLNVFLQSRLKLGLPLSIAPGFLVGTDIIKAAVSPSWEEIGHFGAVVAI